MISNDNKVEQAIVSKKVSKEIREIAKEKKLSTSKTLAALIALGLASYKAGEAIGDIIVNATNKD